MPFPSAAWQSRECVGFRNRIFSSTHTLTPTHTHSAPRVGNALSSCLQVCWGSQLGDPAETAECLPLTIGPSSQTTKGLLTPTCVMSIWAAPLCCECGRPCWMRECECVFVCGGGCPVTVYVARSASKLDTIWSNPALPLIEFFSFKTLLLSLDQLNCMHDISKLKCWPIRFICPKFIVVLIAIGLVCCVVFPIFCPFFFNLIL